MKRNKLNHFFAGCNVLLCLLVAGGVVQPLSAQMTYTFTSCGAVGGNGPTQGQVNAAYTGANTLNGQVTILGQGIQQWAVPGGGQYKIEAWGAKGGNSAAGQGGKGAYMSGEFNLAPGTILKIVVGQVGSQTSDNTGSGGGGGSFVADMANTPLLVAGGGGGCGPNTIVDIDGSIAGAKNGASGGGCAGVGSNGGTICGSMAGSCGGGFSTDGATSTVRPTAIGGKAFVNGAVGGVNEGGVVGSAGFGGGGGGGTNCGYGGGGGGYSGGGGGGFTSPCGGNGGGGGSFNAGTNQLNIPAVSVGDGTVIITRLCNVDLQASKNPICFGESASLTTNAVSNVVWGHTPSTSTLVNVSPTSNTTYTVVGQAATGCTTSVLLTVTVNPVPVLSAVVIPSVLCIGNAATIIPSGGISYTWTASSQVALTTTVNPVLTSNFNYTGKNQYGCTTTTQVAVTVNTNSLGITPNSAVCAGNSIVLTANNAVTYTWSTGNNFQSTPVTPVTNTTYMASGTDIHNCVISNQVNITVEQKPNVTASAGKSTICKGESTTLNASGANTYTWSGSLGGGAQVTVNPPVDVVYSYTVTGTSANGCENTAVVAVTVSKCTGLSKTGGDVFNSRIYPNPTSGEVTVELNNGLTNSIEVTDLTGRVIMNVDTKEEVVNLNLNKLSNGVYYFKIKSTEHVEIIKVVKSN